MALATVAAAEPPSSMPESRPTLPYDGAAPGAPAKARPRSHGPRLVTWVGFQKTDQGARVFLRLSSAVPMESVTQRRNGNELVVKLAGVALDTRNNARPLDTRYLGTDVHRVWAKSVTGGVELHVRFAKAAVDGAIATAPADEGVYFTIDFE